MPEVTRVGGVRFTIEGDNRDLNRKVAQARRRLRSLETAAKKAGAKLRSLRLPAGVSIGVAFGLAARSGLKFETSLSRIVGLVGVSRREVNKMGEAIKRLGPEVSRGPNELADALFFITSAGFRGQEAMQVLEASAKAASAGLGETKAIADAVTSAINAYGSENLKAGRATGILVAAVREGKIEAESLAPVLGKLLPIAAQLNVGFDQVAAALAHLSRGGLNASEAATSLRGVLQVLLKPSRLAVKEFQAAGVSIENLQGTLQRDGLLAALKLLRDSVGGSSRAISKLFPNIEGAVGVFSLLTGNAKDAEKIFKTLASTTEKDLDKAFSVAAETTQDKLNKALADLERIGINIAKRVLPPLVNGLNAVLGLGDQVGEMEPRLSGAAGRRARRGGRNRGGENRGGAQSRRPRIDLPGLIEYPPSIRDLTGAAGRRARRDFRTTRPASPFPEISEAEFGTLTPEAAPARPETGAGGGTGAGESEFRVKEVRDVEKAYAEAMLATREGIEKIEAEEAASRDRRLAAVRDALVENVISEKRAAQDRIAIIGHANQEIHDRTAAFREREKEAKLAEFEEKMEADRRFRDWEISLLDEKDADLARLADWYVRQSEIAEEFRQQEQLSEAQHQANMAALRDKWQKRFSGIEAKHATAREKFAKMSTQKQVKQVLGELGGLLSGVQTNSKKVFAVQKAAAIANAVVNTYQGVTKSLSAYPWPLAGIMAAAHAAAGFAQVQSIASQQVGGGTGGGSASIGGGSTSAPNFSETPVGQNLGTGAEEETRNAIDVRIQDIGDEVIFTGRQMRSLIDQINEQIEDGAVIRSIGYAR